MSTVKTSTSRTAILRSNRLYIATGQANSLQIAAHIASMYRQFDDHYSTDGLVPNKSLVRGLLPVSVRRPRPQSQVTEYDPRADI